MCVCVCSSVWVYVRVCACASSLGVYTTISGSLAGDAIRCVREFMYLYVRVMVYGRMCVLALWVLILLGLAGSPVMPSDVRERVCV